MTKRRYYNPLLRPARLWAMDASRFSSARSHPSFAGEESEAVSNCTPLRIFLPTRPLTPGKTA